MLHEVRSSLCVLFFYFGNLGSRIAGVQKADHGYDVPLQVYRRKRYCLPEKAALDQLEDVEVEENYQDSDQEYYNINTSIDVRNNA
uniref:Uncharacterized protein n=1 Tax=Caenorhabditis japonica TaxID=281687 RepID=A0A8R1DL42_CAEJA